MDGETRTAPRPVGPHLSASPGIEAEASQTGDARGAYEEAAAAVLQVRDRGRYAVVAEHGRGGVGRVLRATDQEFGRDVAVKELLQRTPASEARFLREAIITARLEHPNVVPVHEAGRWPDGTPFYAMKLVAGRPLAALIDEARTRPDRLALLQRVLAVADAMAFAHDRGVIHRDLKPSNVIVGDYGETVVIDWGLAKYLAEPDDDGRLPDREDESLPSHRTKTGAVLGTPAYMAPEQAFGGAVTKRTDVYALGAILLDVLAGRTPARASTSDGSIDFGAAERDVDRRIPAALRSIARRALAPSQWNRYADAKEFGDDLRRFLAGQVVATHRYSVRERVARWLGAHPRLVPAAATALVALLAASTWFLAREAGLRGEAETARQAALEERDRADRQTAALLEQQGRAELSAGHPFRAAPFLAEVYRRDPTNRPVRWMLTESLRALDSLSTSFRATLPGVDPAENATFSVNYSPDDSELAIGHYTAMSFWDSTGTFKRKLAFPVQMVGGRHSRDGSSLLLTFGLAGDTPAWRVDAATGKELVRVPVGRDADCVAWSSDGRYLASLKRSGRVDIWSASSTASRVRSFQAAPRPVFKSLAMSPDGSLVAARGTEEVILASRTDGALRRFALPGDNVQQVVFSPDSRRLLATLADRSVRIWDTGTGRAVGKLPPLDAPPFVALFNGDSSLVATADAHSLRVWDVSSTIALAGFELQTRDPPFSAMFAHRGSRLVTLAPSGLVRTWELPRDRWARPLPGHRGRLRGKYLGSGERIVTADEGEDGRARMRLWSSRTGELLHSWPIEWDPESDVAVSSDGARVALLGRDRRPRILDADSGRVDLVLAVEAGRILDLAFSPDGRVLVAAAHNGTVLRWSADDGGALGTLGEPSADAITSIAFSPDGSGLLVAGNAPSRIWNSMTARVVRELPAASTTVAAYSSDGRHLITAGDGGENSPKIWNAATGDVTTSLESSGAVFDSIAMSPDGSLVAGVDEYGRITIWDAATGATLRSIKGPTEASLPEFARYAHGVNFSPDGKRLLATGPGYALIWTIELDQRSPAEVDALVAAKSPWRLVDGRLIRRQP